MMAVFWTLYFIVVKRADVSEECIAFTFMVTALILVHAEGMWWEKMFLFVYSGLREFGLSKQWEGEETGLS